MNKQEFLQLKIRETQQAINDAKKNPPSIDNPRLKASYDKFMVRAQFNLIRYAKGELNESEQYRLDIENTYEYQRNTKLFNMHNQ